MANQNPPRACEEKGGGFWSESKSSSGLKLSFITKVQLWGIDVKQK